MARWTRCIWQSEAVSLILLIFWWRFLVFEGKITFYSHCIHRNQCDRAHHSRPVALWIWLSHGLSYSSSHQVLLCLVLEEGMVIQYSAWRTPRTEKLGGLHTAHGAAKRQRRGAAKHSTPLISPSSHPPLFNSEPSRQTLPLPLHPLAFRVPLGTSYSHLRYLQRNFFLPLHLFSLDSNFYRPTGK